MRCRTLAREMKNRGAEVIFLCRRQAGDLIALLRQEFRVLALPEQPSALCEGLEGRELYGAWLGCSQNHDAEACLTILKSVGVRSADWLVVDHYGLDASWEAQLVNALGVKTVTPNVLAIDDLADRPHQADMILDQNLFGTVTNQRYQGLVPGHCRQLLGPHYALLGPEYATLHPLIPARTELRRLLVFFGGVDPDNLTGRTLEALMDPELAHLTVDVVIGRQSPHRKATEDLVAQRPLTTLHGPMPSLAGLIARADMAIGAGGATTWERVCLKLPSLVVTIAENQRAFAEALHQAGHLQLLGEGARVGAGEIRSALLNQVANPRLQDTGCDLTDGWGASRIAVAMLGPQTSIKLRSADASDAGLVQRAQEQAGSISPDLRSPSNHRNWFNEGLPNPNRLQLIATTADGCPIGQIHFCRQPLPKENGHAEAIVDLWLDQCVRGFGLEVDLISQGLKIMEQAWGPNIKAGTEERITSQKAKNACFSRANIVDEENISYLTPSISCKESLELPPSNITILSDRGSWLNQYLPDLIKALWQRKHVVRWIHHPKQLATGEVCFLLSCGRLLNSEQLALNRHNLVVHESALPHGQGWSPMTWQILEGAQRIPVTLFEAVAELDAGPTYLQLEVDLKGNELVEEWRALQARATMELCVTWLDRYHQVIDRAETQKGEASHYRRRRPADSELNPHNTLAEQLDLLRVVDNKFYPAFFNLRGRRYELMIRSKPISCP